MNKEELAKLLHNEYERLSKLYNWDTQKDCKVEFNKLPENNKKVMLWLSEFIINKICNEYFHKWYDEWNIACEDYYSWR